MITMWTSRYFKFYLENVFIFFCFQPFDDFLRHGELDIILRRVLDGEPVSLVQSLVESLHHGLASDGLTVVLVGTEEDHHGHQAHCPPLHPGSKVCLLWSVVCLSICLQSLTGGWGETDLRKLLS